MAQVEPLLRVLSGFAHDPPPAPQFTALRVPATPQAREGLITSFSYRLGVEQRYAAEVTRGVMAIPREALETTGPGDSPWRPTDQVLMHGMHGDLRNVAASASDLYQRLAGIHRELGQPYSGNAGAYVGHPWGRPNVETFADRGVERAVEVLQMFPDMADKIYTEAGLTQVTGFPPRAKSGTLTGDGAQLVNHIDEFLDDQATWSIISTVGLIAAGVLLTVVTAGMAGPLVGMAVGAGIGGALAGHPSNGSHRGGHRRRDCPVAAPSRRRREPPRRGSVDLDRRTVAAT